MPALIVIIALLCLNRRTNTGAGCLVLVAAMLMLAYAIGDRMVSRVHSDPTAVRKVADAEVAGATRSPHVGNHKNARNTPRNAQQLESRGKK